MDLPGSATIHSALDGNWGFWPLEIAKEHEYKSFFTFHHGLFHFTRRCFGLKHTKGPLNR